MIRIEHQQRLALLEELPEDWVQATITGPPRAACECKGERLEMLAVLGQLHRITRPDGTLLWDINVAQPQPLRRLVLSFTILGWSLQHSPIAAAAGYLLFTKQQTGSYWHPHTPNVRLTAAGRRPSACPRPTLGRARRPWCIPASGWPSRQQRRLEWVLLAATGPCACGACGTPWVCSGSRRHEHGPLLSPGCMHRNPAGRCLVLDPYHQPDSPLAMTAVRYGRSYLGIQPPAEEDESR